MPASRSCRGIARAVGARLSERRTGGRSGAGLSWIGWEQFVVAGKALGRDAKSCGTVLELVRDACPSNGSLPGRITRWGPSCCARCGECGCCREIGDLVQIVVASRRSAKLWCSAAAVGLTQLERAILPETRATRASQMLHMSSPKTFIVYARRLMALLVPYCCPLKMPEVATSLFWRPRLLLLQVLLCWCLWQARHSTLEHDPPVSTCSTSPEFPTDT
jgi:hypothetical protein